MHEEAGQMTDIHKEWNPPMADVMELIVKSVKKNGKINPMHVLPNTCVAVDKVVWATIRKELEKYKRAHDVLFTYFDEMRGYDNKLRTKRVDNKLKKIGKFGEWDQNDQLEGVV